MKTGGEEDATHYTIEYTGCSSSCDRGATEEAGSIVLQISRSLSVFENESKELQETTSAAAKKSDQYVDKDVEILRLIEER